ncbi:MAG TPA: hypothetical protein VK400_20025 [Pyrinomonadaceae bacterium]|nr:hypothetical protein [Pyrinomonadaceae bacterium]
MQSNYLIKFAVLIICLISSGSAAYADVKIKTRQSVSGQTSENTTYIKGKRQRSEMMGGKMISITQCDLRRDVQIMPEGKVYMVNPFDNGAADANQTVSQTQTTTKLETGGTVTMTVTTKDTGERKQMFGYTAKHLIITMESVASADACSKSNSKMQMDGWYIDATWYFQCDRGYANGYTPKSSGGCRDKYVMKQVGGSANRGYPVWEKMTMFDESGKEIMTSLNEVVELSQATLDASLFDVPQGYREVKDSSQLYASMYNQSGNNSNSGANRSSGSDDDDDNDTPSNSGMSQNVKNMSTKSAEPTSVSTTVGAKKEGTVRIGLAGVKTGSIGEGLNAAELAGAIQNTLGEYLKGTKIELVQMEAKLPSAIDAEAKQKECDYVLYATVSHKKGGGGFGMLSKIAPAIGNVVPVSSMGTRTGQAAGQIARTTIYTAGDAAANVKSKDELTLEIKLNAIGGGAALAKQYKSKAKSDGEDVISPLVEQAATAILETVSK